MLVLTRKEQQKIHVGNDITVTIVRIKGNSVRVGIEAPRHVRVIRAELESHQDEPPHGDPPPQGTSTARQTADSPHAGRPESPAQTNGPHPLREPAGQLRNLDPQTAESKGQRGEPPHKREAPRAAGATAWVPTERGTHGECHHPTPTRRGEPALSAARAKLSELSAAPASRATLIRPPQRLSAAALRGFVWR
jgi:carbon storage regulator